MRLIARSTASGAQRIGWCRPALVLAAALGCCLAFSAVAAAAKTMQEKMQAACADDIARLCPREADPEHVKPCMLKHRSDASAACMRYIDASE